MVAQRRIFDLLEHYEQLACHIVNRIENGVHEVVGRLFTEVEQTSTSPEQKKSRVGSVFYSSVNNFFKAFAFGESKKVFHRVTKPSLIIKRLEKSWHEVLPRIFVVFKRLDAILELEEHVEADDHHLFQVWIRNLLVKEVPSNKCSEALLEGYVRKQTNFSLW